MVFGQGGIGRKTIIIKYGRCYIRISDYIEGRWGSNSIRIIKTNRNIYG